MKDLLLVGLLLSGALYYEFNVNPSTSLVAIQPVEPSKDEEEGGCPEGYVLSEDGTACNPVDGSGDSTPAGNPLMPLLQLAGITAVSSIVRKALTPSDAKLKAEADAKLKADADAKLKADADAKLKLAKQSEIDKLNLPKEDPVLKKANAVADSDAAMKKVVAEGRDAAKLKAATQLLEAEKSIAKASKLSKLGKLGKLAKGGPWGFLFTALTMTLSATLDLDPESFNPCQSGEYDVNSLPDWAKMIISQVPILGDLMDMMGYLLCVSNKCGPNEEEGKIGVVPTSFCYTPCNSGFTSDGVAMCYKNYPAFENNGMLHTITSITKKINLNTGRPVSTCGDNEDKDAGLCYSKCNKGYSGVGPVCWKQTYGVGVGTPVGLEPCPDGWTNDGLTCREPLGWNSECVWWNWGALGGYWTGCATGGRVVGRLNNGGTCPDWKERIDGLCYNKCGPGEEHVAGMPYLCGPIGSLSYGRGVGKPMSCKSDEKNIAGLCYSSCPDGYSMDSLGLCSQQCPDGAPSFGVGCVRESYSRGVGRPKLMLTIKSRKAFRNFVERATEFGNAINPF